MAIKVSHVASPRNAIIIKCESNGKTNTQCVYMKVLINTFHGMSGGSFVSE